MKNEKIGVSKAVILFSLLITVFVVVYLLQNLVQSNKVVTNDQAATRPANATAPAVDNDYHSYGYCLIPNFGTPASTIDISISSNLKSLLHPTRTLKIFATTNVRGTDYVYLGQIDPKKIPTSNKVLSINKSILKGGEYTFYAWQFSPLVLPTATGSQKQQPISVPTPTHPPKEISDSLLRCIIFRVTGK